MINGIILVLAIPVIAIAFVSLLVYFLFIKLAALAGNRQSSQEEEPPYHMEIELVNNRFLKLLMVEDESDQELTALNEWWTEHVYNEETCLYRARTAPLIPDLENKIICFYLKELPEGALLQELIIPVNPQDAFSTRLILVDFHTLSISSLTEAGDYYLYNDEKNERLIRGFNKKERISIELLVNNP